ncbi:hypothetical protein BC739_006678 [Kutzneria viridogrisea]|uniref:Uncharacterized protein n=1 Tax=Kutzneria viridogrisea TaxID=47990 RepID=A0ABR6BRZ6_9PSEU|nr:hypothetical protein [Kutzneria viridogrisea]
MCICLRGSASFAELVVGMEAGKGACPGAEWLWAYVEVLVVFPSLVGLAGVALVAAHVACGEP